jgi:putative addiction module killer protein
MKSVIIYQAANGKEPYTRWLDSLRDKKAVSIIDVRISRARLGNLGSHRSVGHGVVELKINFGAGYRVYLGHHSDELVVLLCGGDKKTQGKDIANAHAYWAEYKEGL